MTLPTIQIQATAPLPVGEYVVRLVALEVCDSQFGSQLKWTLEVASPVEYQGRRLVAYTSLSNSAQSKLARWATALLQRELQPNEQLDLNTLLQRHARAVVITREKDGREYNRVDDLRPLKTSHPFAPADAGDPFH